MYDIAIIGLGPSGSTLARLLSRKFKILAIDKRNLTAPFTEGMFEKSCGGLLAPDAQKMLAALGLGLPKEVLVGPQLFAVRTIDIQNKLETYYQRHYINIDREKFDRWLISLISDGIEIRDNSVFKSMKMDKDSVSLDFSSNGVMYSEKAKIIIGADGAFSSIRKLLNPSTNPKTYISIQEWFESDKPEPFFSAIFDQEITDFYTWTIPKEDLLIVGTAIEPGKDTIKTFELLKNKLKNYGFKLDKKVKHNGAFILRPLKTEQIYTGNQRAGLIGEAAGFISPSSAEGLSYAFNSAVLLANSIEKSLDDFLKYYNMSSNSLKTNILIKNLKCPMMYNPVLRKSIMSAGIKSLKLLR